MRICSAVQLWQLLLALRQMSGWLTLVHAAAAPHHRLSGRHHRSESWAPATGMRRKGGRLALSGASEGVGLTKLREAASQSPCQRAAPPAQPPPTQWAPAAAPLQAPLRLLGLLEGMPLRPHGTSWCSGAALGETGRPSAGRHGQAEEGWAEQQSHSCLPGRWRTAVFLHACERAGCACS